MSRFRRFGVPGTMFVAGLGWAAFEQLSLLQADMSVLVFVCIFAATLLAGLGGPPGPFKSGLSWVLLAVTAGHLLNWWILPVTGFGFFETLRMIDEFGLFHKVLVFGSLVSLLVIPFILPGVADRKLFGSAKPRRRARSDLYGDARLRDGNVRSETGLILGQEGRDSGSPLVIMPLEGSAITLAPPRTGKGATIALNMLLPGGRGFTGSTVLIDPRGEIWCVTARRRRQLGRRVHLIDPFGVVARHAERFPELHLPDMESAFYNPLDFIREDNAVQDIEVLLDALLTPPPKDSHGVSQHFQGSARTIICGYLDWVRFGLPPERRNLATLRQLVLMSPDEQDVLADTIRSSPGVGCGLAIEAIELQASVGKDEAGSNYSTVANQLKFLSHEQLRHHTSRSTFDPMTLADGDVDLFVVVPEHLVNQIRGWLRLWVTIPNAIPNYRNLEKDLLIIIDELPRIGYLQPVMDAYPMAAGNGVHFWCFAQSDSALDARWGRDNRKTLSDLAEIKQILGLPRTDAAGAEELSKVIGNATFEAPTRNRSGSVSRDPVLQSISQRQFGESRSLVGRPLVSAESLMAMEPDRQYVFVASKELPREPYSFFHAKYWLRDDTCHLADPNPFVLRKETGRRN